MARSFGPAAFPGRLRTGVSRDCGNLAVDHQALYAAVNDQCLRIDPAGGATLSAYGLPQSPYPSRNRWGYVGLLDGLLIGSCTSGGTVANCLFAVEPGGAGRFGPIADARSPNRRSRWATAKCSSSTRPSTPATRHRCPGSPPRFAASGATARPGPVVALDARVRRSAGGASMRLSRRGRGNHVQRRQAGPVRDLHRRPQLAAVLRGRSSLAAGNRALRRGRQAALDAVGRLPRPPLDCRQTRCTPSRGPSTCKAAQRRRGSIRSPAGATSGSSPAPGTIAAAQRLAAVPLLPFVQPGVLRPGGRFRHAALRRAAARLLDQFRSRGGTADDARGQRRLHVAFPNMCSVVFEPVHELKGFGFYSTAGPLTPVRRLAVNFGAPGDRNDAAGQLWLGYPRPAGSLGLPLELETAFCPGGGYVNRNSVYNATSGTADRWLFASAARGLALGDPALGARRRCGAVPGAVADGRPREHPAGRARVRRQAPGQAGGRRLRRRWRSRRTESGAGERVFRH